MDESGSSSLPRSRAAGKRQASASPPRERVTIQSLRERAKELDCLYQVEEILARPGVDLQEVFRAVAAAVPSGLRYPQACEARIQWAHVGFTSVGYRPTPWRLRAPLRLGRAEVGEIEVCYRTAKPEADIGPFLKEEARLIAAIADRLGLYVEQQTYRSDSKEWRGAVRLLRVSEPDLYVRVARRMLRHLCQEDVADARAILERTSGPAAPGGPGEAEGYNRPGRRARPDDAFYLTAEPFELAAKFLTGDEIQRLVQSWMFEEKANALARSVSNQDSPLLEIAKALRRFIDKVPDESQLPPSTREGIVVSLIRRFLTDDLTYIAKAKRHLRIVDFRDLAGRMIYAADSKGRIGGKSTGLFLAERILASRQSAIRGDFAVEVPRSWYVTSDGLFDFTEYNDLRDWIIEQKYKDIDQVRQEYPLLLQLFKNARFPPEIVNSLSAVLDDFHGRPLIVRSSSRGEDARGSSFSGKYKSLFLANEGSKSARLEAVLDAVAEVYASTFGPDPIEYRRERGLLDFDEGMGILLQEVVGSPCGRYYFPAFSGVAMTNNEVRWSARIERHDGLIRMVPGLGTRAVDRLDNDYPVLVAPGKPAIRASASVEEKVRYAPRMIDVVDLESKSFATRRLSSVLEETEGSYPAFDLVFSVYDHDRLSPPSRLAARPDGAALIPTFDGLIGNTTFIRQMTTIMEVLQEELSTPVDIEFASDGKSIYVLQCRAQGSSADVSPVPIPDVPEKDILFRADRYVSNGLVSNISHIVYVDPLQYAGLRESADMKAVATAIGRLNQVLPRRRFVLMGPGRWGSRGDIRLGVGVSYADISNTAMLIEIALKRGEYAPDPSFGTHFFQDLVESSIGYLPLYLEYPESGLGATSGLNEAFFAASPNGLERLAPDYAGLAGVIKVVDVPAVTNGRVLWVAMNGDESRAIGFFARPS